MRPIVRAGAGIAVALMLAACSGGPTTAPTSAPTSAATPPPVSGAPTAAPATAAAGPCVDVTDSGEATTVDASVEGFVWQPETINAKVGDVITWTNGDSAPHGVGLADRSCRMSTNMGGGQSRSLKFTVAGEFPFVCTVHPDMKGTFVITE